MRNQLDKEFQRQPEIFEGGDSEENGNQPRIKSVNKDELEKRLEVGFTQGTLFGGVLTICLTIILLAVFAMQFLNLLEPAEARLNSTQVFYSEE